MPKCRSKVTSQEVRVIQGDPDPALILTSYVERHNLSVRMGMRRFTRLTNAFSKKVRNHAATVALDTLHYNFARPPSIACESVSPDLGDGGWG